MRIFLSYASEDLATAERLFQTLCNAGHDVFFDHESLPRGDTFDLRILQAIEESDLMVVLLSPEFFAPGAYTLTELGFARRRWPNPARRVLPVVARPIEIEHLPPYLRSVSVLQPDGDLVAETAAAVEALRRPWLRIRGILPWAIVLVVTGVGAVTLIHQNGLWRGQMCVTARAKAETVARELLSLTAAVEGENEALFRFRPGNSADTWRGYDEQQRACDDRYVPRINQALGDLRSVAADVDRACSPGAQQGPSEFPDPIDRLCGYDASDLKAAAMKYLEKMRGE